MTPSQIILNMVSANLTDVIAFQEPYWDYLGNTRSNSNWNVVYLPGHKTAKKKARSVMLVSKRISSNTWEELC